LTKIKKLECWDVSMPLIEPYTIAYETITHAPNVLLSIVTDDGYSGYGCAAPDLEVTGESAQGLMHKFNEIALPYLEGKDPHQIARINADLRSMLPDSPSLMAMIDMALYDLMAKKAGLPVYKLLGGYRQSIPTSITIGILPVVETLDKTDEYIRKGFFIIKVKGGSDVEEDIQRIAAIRKKFGKETIIRFDANQGYTVQETIYFVKHTRDQHIEILEQPTHRYDLESLGRVTKELHLPVMADESLLTLQDAFKLARNGWADMVNIKLMKVGGISGAMHINSVAKAAGMEAMIGCMDECELGISAGLHFALARPNVEYADLDGHLDLLDDPTSGCFTLKEGVLYPNDRPGLGWK
jgi:L-alanine-DL-glutamate epimerase-like enolase superfamily enzyme